MAPAAAPAGAAAKKQMKGADRRASLLAEKTAKEKKAQEEAAEAQRLEDEKAEQEKEKQRVMRTAMAAKTATVKSQDFEGCWRSGGEYEIRYIMKKAGKFLLHVWCDLEGNGIRERLPGSPFKLEVSAASPTCAGSTVEGALKRTYIAGERLMLRPQLRDVFGNPTTATDEREQVSQQDQVTNSIMAELVSQHSLTKKAGGMLCARQRRRPRRPSATRARQSMS